MTTKFAPLNANVDRTRSMLRPDWRFPLQRFSSISPSYIPIHLKNLKPNTRYNIFVRSGDGNSHEDITRLCRPLSQSKGDNIINDDKEYFDYFVSSNLGSLSVEARPFGTDTINLENINWSSYWRHIQTRSPYSDVTRTDFFVVESNNVKGEPGNKYRTISQPVPSVCFPFSKETQDDLYIKQTFLADYVQSFFIDPNRTNNSNTVDLTSITLYFREKPSRENNLSGIRSPGVTIALVDIEDGKPILKRQYENSISEKRWTHITESVDATAPTKFAFSEPVRLKTGEFYGIAISFDDPMYELWECKVGDLLVGTDTPSAGPSNQHRGTLFELTNADTELKEDNFDNLFTSRIDRDLKFDIAVAKYDLSEDITITAVNEAREFLSLSANGGNWHGDEYVYQVNPPSQFNDNDITMTVGSSKGSKISANQSGIDLNEIFEEGETIVAVWEKGGRFWSEVISIDQVHEDYIVPHSPVSRNFSNAKIIQGPIGRVGFYDSFNSEIFLTNSTARTGFVFAENETIRGAESNQEATIESINPLPVSVFSTNFDLDLPSNFTFDSSYKFTVDGELVSEYNKTNLKEPNYVTKYNGEILSRSQEIVKDLDYSTEHKIQIHYDGPTTSFESVELDISSMSIVTHFWLINDDDTDEHTNDGKALTKHISNRLTFKKGQAAEDIRVIANAYRPQGTEIRMFAKIIGEDDSEPFDDKHWTPLVITDGEGQWSDSSQQFDYKEFEFGFPPSLESSDPHPGTFNVVEDNGNPTDQIECTEVIVGLDVGNIIKLYDPLFADVNYGFFSVQDINGSTITVNEVIESDNLRQDLKVDRVVEKPHTAFNNPLNSNVVRYFDSGKGAHDNYVSVVIKIVLLADSPRLVPKVDDYRVIGVSV